MAKITPIVSYPSGGYDTGETAKEKINEAMKSVESSAKFSGDGNIETELDIEENAITNAELAQIAQYIIKGRVSAETGNVEDLTVAQVTAMLNQFTNALKGLVPASGGGTTNFLRADGNWADPGSGISDTPQAWSSTIQFDGNYGSFNTNAHTQSGAITFSINWTGAIFGTVTNRIIESNGDTITIPEGVESIINNATGSFVGREFTPVDGNRYRFVFECTDVSNQKYNCLVRDSEAYVEPVHLNAPVLTSATTASSSQINLVFTDTNTDPNEVEVEIEYDTVNTFDDDPQTTTAVQDATTKSVTGLDPDTEYFFRVRAVGNGVTTLDSDWSNIESDTTDVASIIIVQDNFAGTTIDTGKWTEVDPTGKLSQNEQLIFAISGSSVAARSHYLESKYDDNGRSIVAVQSTLSGISGVEPGWYLSLWEDDTADNEITILPTTGDYARLVIRQSSSTVYDFSSTISINNVFKIVRDGNDIKFYYLSAPDTWTQIGTTQTYAMPVLKPALVAFCGTTQTGTVYQDDFYFSSDDYSTSVPS